MAKPPYNPTETCIDPSAKEKVTTLRGGSPPITDIPAMMRQMANWIEKGGIKADSVLFIIDRDGDWPDVYGWGEHLGDYGNIAVCELVKQYFINNLTERKL